METWKFLKSSTNQSNWFEDNEKEVAFIGRSNVGKSSLINALTNHKKLAITSSTPGRTKLINFFSNGKQFFVDLPGYGWAKMSKKEQSTIGDTLNEYFLTRKQLFYVFLLIDSKMGITLLDKLMIEFLQTNYLNFSFVCTKADKANQSEIFKTTKDIKQISDDFIFVSVKSKKNIEVLRDSITKMFI